jgi:hypothetical protein
MATLSVCQYYSDYYLLEKVDLAASLGLASILPNLLALKCDTYNVLAFASHRSYPR